MKYGLCGSVLVWCLFSTPVNVLGQVNYGEIRGRVSDSLGAVVPGAKIVATFIDQNAVRQATSDMQGDYVIPTLEPGPYMVSIEHVGFKTVEQGPVVLTTGQTIVVDVQMQVGSVSEKVEINATPALVNTSTSEVSGVIFPRAIEAMPLLGRDYLSLAVLLPGTNPGAPGDARQSGGGVYAGIDTVEGSAQAAVSTSGAEPDSNRFYLDGMDNTDYFQRNPIARPTIDAIVEFEVATSLPSVEYAGAGGGVISATTKSGGNTYHGVAFDFLRNDVFDARSFFDVQKPTRRRNQFGGVLSGPLSIPKIYDAKNKTFFLFDYEGLRFRSQATSTISVPTSQERTGDFSSVLPGTIIYNPLDVVAGQRVPFPNNVIPSGQVNPISQKVVALFPEPNRPGIANNYVGSSSLGEDYDNILARVDQNFGDKDHIFGRFTYSDDTIPGASLLPLSASNTTLNSTTGALYWNHIVSPKLLAEFRGAITRRVPYTIPQSIEDTAAVTALGFANFGVGGMPGISTSYINTIGGGLVFQKVFTALQLEEKVTKITGRHAIKAGFGAYVYRQDFLLTSTSLGSESFDGNLTRQIGSSPSTSPYQSMAQLLLGLPSNQSGYGAQVPGAQKTRTRDTNYYMFVNDDFKVSERLTLNLGLRYEMMLPPIYPNGRGATYFDYQSGQLLYASNAPIPSGCCPWPYRLDTTKRMYDADWTDFGPRIGFAYSLDKRTVVRGGYGIYYDDGILGNLAFGAGLDSPFFSTASATVNLDETNPANLFNLNQNVTTLAPYTVPINAAFFNKGFRNGRIQERNLSFEQQLSDSTLLSLAYVGSKGEHLLDADVPENIPLPAPGDLQSRRQYPDFGANLQYSSYAYSQYNALQAMLEQRLWKNLSGLVSYTWAKVINNLPNNNGTTADAALHTHANDWWLADRGVGDSDVRQRFVVSAIYASPALGSSRLTRLLSNGWELAPIYTAQSGFPYSVYVSADTANIGTGGRIANRAQYVCCGYPNLPNNQRTIARYFNTAAFAIPAPYTYGDSGRNMLQAEGINNLDASISRTFTLTERQKLQFRLESFNTLNRAQLGIPDYNIDDPGVGTVTTTQNFGRELQWALKWMF